MLSLLEKVQYGLSGVVILGCLGLYLWQGNERQNVQILKPPELIKPKPAAAPSAASKTPGLPLSAPTPAPAAPDTSKDDAELLARLLNEQKAPVAGKKIEHQDYSVPKDTMKYLEREANWIDELGKAGSDLLMGADGKNTRIRLKNIDEDSLLKKFGFENGDTVEFIDGEKIDFEDKVNHPSRMRTLLAKVQKGQKITVTVTRGGQPMQISFQPQAK